MCKNRRRPMRPSPLLLGTLIVCASTIVGCGGGGSDDQAKIEQARHEGAVAAHHADEVQQLRKQVSSLKRESGGSPAPVPAAPVQTATAPSEDPRIPASGTYSGQAAQRGTPARVNKDFPLDMTFASTGSYVSYPTLGCHGTLRPIGFAGEDRVYEEEITAGHCDSGGTWHVRVDSVTSLAASWTLPSASYTVSATLSR